jgi:hypothetical protein
MPFSNFIFKFNYSLNNLRERYYNYRLPSLKDISKSLSASENIGARYSYFSPEKELERLTQLLNDPAAQFDVRKPIFVALEHLAINFEFLRQRIITQILYIIINDANNRIAAINALSNSKHYLPQNRVDEVVTLLLKVIKTKNDLSHFRQHCAVKALNNLQSLIPTKFAPSIIKYVLRAIEGSDEFKGDCETLLNNYVSVMSDSQKLKYDMKLSGKEWSYGLGYYNTCPLIRKYPEFIQIPKQADFTETLNKLISEKLEFIILSGYNRKIALEIFAEQIARCTDKLKYLLFSNLLNRFANDYLAHFKREELAAKVDFGEILCDHFSKIPEQIKICFVKYALDNMVVANKYEVLDKIAIAVIKDKSRAQLQPYFILTFLKYKNNPSIYAALVPIILKFYHQTSLCFANNFLITKLNVTNKSRKNSNQFVLVEEVMQYAGLKH